MLVVIHISKIVSGHLRFKKLADDEIIPLFTAFAHILITKTTTKPNLKSLCQGMSQ